MASYSYLRERWEHVGVVPFDDKILTVVSWLEVLVNTGTTKKHAMAALDAWENR